MRRQFQTDPHAGRAQTRALQRKKLRRHTLFAAATRITPSGKEGRNTEPVPSASRTCLFVLETVLREVPAEQAAVCRE